MKKKDFFTVNDKFNLQLDTIEGYKRWFHVLPYGEISYDGDIWNVDSGTMDNIYNNLRKYLAVGGMPVVLMGFHSDWNEDKDYYGCGFVIDGELLYEKTEDKAAGLWLQVDIRNEMISGRVQTGELRSCSGGFINWPLELAKTGEVLEGWRLDHLTLTNNPRITWLDKSRAEFTEKSFSQKVIQLVQNVLRKDHNINDKNPDNENENNNIIDTGDDSMDEAKFLAEQMRANQLQEKIDLLEAESNTLKTEKIELAEKLRVFEEKAAAAEQAEYESKLKQLAEKNILPAAKIEEYKTGEKKLDLATIDEILANHVGGISLTEGILNQGGNKDSIELGQKMKSAFGIKEEK